MVTLTRQQIHELRSILSAMVMVQDTHRMGMTTSEEALAICERNAKQALALVDSFSHEQTP